MKTIEFKVTTCAQCPFSNSDCDYGLNACNHPESKLDLDTWEQLPRDKVHNLCPLKDNNILVSLYKS